MTRIKLCGITRLCEAKWINELRPDFAGFVFVPASRRHVSAEQAEILRQNLDAGIRTVGVFADEKPERVAELLQSGSIDAVQLHGSEDENYLASLRKMADCPIIQAFRIRNEADTERANRSSAELVLLDSGGGTGTLFDHSLLHGIRRPYFLAGGLTPENVGGLIQNLEPAPWGVDASSSLETDRVKDLAKMTAFVQAVRKE
ncbi:MAG: phosphoribosylanthranilate isomerase [Thermoguttaceae bacterium]|nr:phosphoribosylanthranilate isomerase [Thermoguttaceae bacterium]